MKAARCSYRIIVLFSSVILSATFGRAAEKNAQPALSLQSDGYFHRRGLDVLVYNNAYDGLFSDAKISSIELIHHDVRTATNGDVRLSATPGQWDAVPTLVSRKVNPETNSVDVNLAYPDYHFTFTLHVEAEGDGVKIQVLSEQGVPAALQGKAGFNLEFLPSAYFHKSYLVDERAGVFPLHPSSDMEKTAAGAIEPSALARGHTLVLAPEDDLRRVTVTSRRGELALYDGRNQATNGWFVVRSLLPANETGVLLEWHLAAHTVSGFTRPVSIGHSQVGYHPNQPKEAIIEQDAEEAPVTQARVLRVKSDGSLHEVRVSAVKTWGRYLRYHYSVFDFSEVKEPGLYMLEAGGVRTKTFRIGPDVYDAIWYPTLDVYMPVAMDHMAVKEAYRVWHGHSHRDDALQAAANKEHFDLYAMGPTTDSPFQPGEHIPGLNVGGWLDAGDFDIRTQTQYAVVMRLVDIWELFGLKRDQTQVDQAGHRVQLHEPDGAPDVLQQIEHGALQLLAQHRAVGHAIHGIIEPDLGQYTHLGDAASKTDGLIFDPKLKPIQSDGVHSGVPDDRLAFTTKSTPLNYGSIAALAAASRALRGWRDDLANECLSTATRVWDEEHTHPPQLYHHGNTTGGPLEPEEFSAAAELLLSTKDPKYAQRIHELWPTLGRYFAWIVTPATRIASLMDDDYRAKLRERAATYAQTSKEQIANPYGVPIWTGGWAGNGRVIAYGINNYMLRRLFPDLFSADPTYRSLNYILGTHPGSDISFVSAVGTVSKEVAYGSNRADFSFIAGGVVPGVLILKPDFPENKEDWPFFWGENEYVINLGPDFIFLANASAKLAAENR